MTVNPTKWVGWGLVVFSYTVCLVLIGRPSLALRRLYSSPNLKGEPGAVFSDNDSLRHLPVRPHGVPPSVHTHVDTHTCAHTWALTDTCTHGHTRTHITWTHTDTHMWTHIHNGQDTHTQWTRTCGHTHTRHDCLGWTVVQSWKRPSKATWKCEVFTDLL